MRLPLEPRLKKVISRSHVGFPGPSARRQTFSWPCIEATKFRSVTHAGHSKTSIRTGIKVQVDDGARGAPARICNRVDAHGSRGCLIKENASNFCLHFCRGDESKIILPPMLRMHSEMRGSNSRMLGVHLKTNLSTPKDHCKKVNGQGHAGDMFFWSIFNLAESISRPAWNNTTSNKINKQTY